MEFVIRSNQHQPARVGILAGSFNPPTVAHLELACAAANDVDEVVFVVPRAFPHKQYFGASLEQRLELLRHAAGELGYSIAIAEGGLFADIARECRSHYEDGTGYYLLCGADAADRIIGWDYGNPRFVDNMLADFQLLVAPRGVVYQPPESFRHRIHPLHMEGKHDTVSSTEVRERIARGEPWEHLVPDRIVDRVRAIYS